MWTERGRRQQSAVAALRELRVGVHYDYEGTRWKSGRKRPFVAAEILGTDYVHSATWVFVMVGDSSDPAHVDVDAALPLLKQLPRLRHIQLVFWNDEVAAQVANVLRRELPGVQIELEPGP
jgi:hypothetical protein